ncbi:hypothetical protein H1R20_g16129, partial [Candolleomyces eurysporus]
MTLRAYQEPVADDQAGQFGEKPGNQCVFFRDLVGTSTNSRNSVPQSPLTPSRSPNVSWSTSTSSGGRLPQPSSPSPVSRKRKRSHRESCLPQAPRNSKANKLGLSDDESPTTHRNETATLTRTSSRSESENRHSANASQPRQVQVSSEPQTCSAQPVYQDSTFSDFDLEELVAENEQDLKSSDEGDVREENEARALQYRELAHQPATERLLDTQVEISPGPFINKEGKATGLQTGYERERLCADFLSTGHIADSGPIDSGKGKETAAPENYSDEEDHATDDSDEDDSDEDSDESHGPSSSSQDIAPSGSAVQVSDPGRSKNGSVGDGNEDNTGKLTGDTSPTSALSDTVQDELWGQHEQALEIEQLNQAADPHRLLKAYSLDTTAAGHLEKMSRSPAPLLYEIDTTRNQEWVEQGASWKYFLKLRDHRVNKLAPSDRPSFTSATSAVAPARNAARPAAGPSATVALGAATTSSNGTLVPTEEYHELYVETSGPVFGVSLHGTIKAPSKVVIQAPIAVPVADIYGESRFATFKDLQDLANSLAWTRCLRFDADGQPVNNRFVLKRHDSPNAPGKWTIRGVDEHSTHNP